MRYLLLHILLIITATASAQQPQWAVIEDPDGFTNIRLQPSSAAPAPHKITIYEVFPCEKQAGDWWKYHVSGTTMQRIFPAGYGYVHKSRVRFVKDLPDSLFSNTCSRILRHYLSIITRRNKLYDEYLANGKKFTPKEQAAYESLGNKGVYLYDNGYQQLMEMMPAFLHRTRDSSLLLDWCHVLTEDTGSASETPGYAMGDLFLMAPEWVLRVIRPLPKRAHSIVIGQIEFGIMMNDQLPPAKLAAFEKRLKQAEKPD